jgi:hypothetical protein
MKPHPTRLSGVAVLALSATILIAPSPAASAPHSSAPHSSAAPSALAVSGRGATVPFTEYEAEAAGTNGTVLAPSRLRNTLAGEASGRSAVTLSGTGRYVEFTLTVPANAVDVRYSVPDSAGGSDYTAPLAVYVDGAKTTDLTLTNRYAWYYGSYPFTNNPGEGNPHHFYDDVRARFAGTLAVGTKVRLQLDSGSTPTTVDLADFEQVGAAISQPSGSLSVTSYGADPTGAADSGSAFTQAIAAASSQGRTLYVPAGTYHVAQHLSVDNVTVQGAGPWYSVLSGNNVGFWGNAAPNPSSNVHIADLAVFGDTAIRNDSDPVNGVGGALGGGSTVTDVWIQHSKVGIWVDGPFDGLTISGCRIQDLTADGVNLHNGVSHVTATNNLIRNTGDDGMAMWSDSNADHDNTFSFNTVELPMLANGIAIYGGHDNAVTDSVVSETQTNGGGIHVANRFSSVLLSGTTTIARDTTLRAGNLDPNWNFGVGALWFDALNGSFNGTVNVTDTNLVDSSYEAIQWVEGGAINGINFTNVDIQGAGTFALQLQTAGSATFTGVTATGIGYPNPIYSCEGSAFTINQGAGNSGWYTASPYCGPWPDPVYGGGGQPNPNLALGRNTSESSHTQNFVGANAVDADANTYWESANNAFPQWLQVDLGSSSSVSRIVLTLPPSSAWGTRTQTIAVSGDAGTIVGAKGYTFDPATGNSVTITFPSTATRNLRLTVTGNTGWPAGQAAGFEVYAA